MSVQPRTRAPAPWITAAVLGVLVAVLVVALVHVRAVRDNQHKEQALSRYQLPAHQQAAIQAGATEAANLLTYSRRAFAADFARGLAGATGSLKKDITSRRTTTLATMTKNKIDLTAAVQESAFEGTDEHGNVLVLVTVDGYSKNDKGVSSVATPQRVELTMVNSGGKWLASNLTSIGIQ
jgi:hypothetical protein